MDEYTKTSENCIQITVCATGQENEPLAQFGAGTRLKPSGILQNLMVGCWRDRDEICTAVAVTHVSLHTHKD